MVERRTEESIAAFRRAVQLNPNSAAARGGLGHCLAFAGWDREAIEHAENAIRLSPLDPDMPIFVGALAGAHYCAGRYAEAARYAEEQLRLRPGFHGGAHPPCGRPPPAGRISRPRAFFEQVANEPTAVASGRIQAT